MEELGGLQVVLDFGCLCAVVLSHHSKNIAINDPDIQQHVS